MTWLRRKTPDIRILGWVCPECDWAWPGGRASSFAQAEEIVERVVEFHEQDHGIR